jgi:hypothetical protein
MKDNNNKIDYLKNREGYRIAKIEGDSLKGYQKAKLTNNFKKEVKAQEAWQTIASVLLLAFVLMAIYFMIYGG